jgi:hypothetical protein
VSTRITGRLPVPQAGAEVGEVVNAVEAIQPVGGEADGLGSFVEGVGDR